MASTEQNRQRFLSISLRTATSALAFAIGIGLTIFVAESVQGQTYKVIYNFTRGQDGGFPDAGLTLDKAGNLYGTASSGGSGNFGTVFKMSYKSSSWVFTPLYGFTGGNDGAGPGWEVAIGSDGALYGTTGGGGSYSYGTVFNLRPSPTSCKTALCPWNEKLVYTFTGGSDGGYPSSELTLDRAGNLYGTTVYGGDSNCDAPYGCGVVYKFEPSPGGWSETVLYAFNDLNDGLEARGRLVMDSSGALYGVTKLGGTYDCGTVYQLAPSGSGWTKTSLHEFQCGDDGAYPWGGLLLDTSGNLYGTTTSQGTGNGGTVFGLTPSGGNWLYSVLYSFQGYPSNNYLGPTGALAMDVSGALYGATSADGAYRLGSVFRLTPSTGGWTYTSLHDFLGGSDGSSPNGDVTRDAAGNLYGTTSSGGTYGSGIVWDITP